MQEFEDPIGENEEILDPTSRANLWGAVCGKCNTVLAEPGDVDMGAAEGEDDQPAEGEKWEDEGEEGGYEGEQYG